MYCPSCAAENKDDVKYCRICGVNLSLVPQALTGQLPQEPAGRRDRKRDRRHPPSMESAIRTIFAGLGFLFAAFGIFFWGPAGKIWWFWMLIPAFGTLGKGVSEYFAVKNQQQNFPQPVNRQAISPPPTTPFDLPSRNTGEMVQPPTSVTESTTKLFDPPTK